MFLKTEKILNDWTDYNKHLNVAYYVLIFERASEVILNKFEMGSVSAQKDKKSTFTIETNNIYKNEVKLNEEVDIFLTSFDHDEKRIHYKMSMVNKIQKQVSATIEVLSIYIDLHKRKVINFEENKKKMMDSFINENLLRFEKNDLVFKEKLKKNN
jgi:acyl-CoA thioester hydrolase